MKTKYCLHDRAKLDPKVPNRIRFFISTNPRPDETLIYPPQMYLADVEKAKADLMRELSIEVVPSPLFNHRQHKKWLAAKRKRQRKNMLTSTESTRAEPSPDAESATGNIA